MPEWCGFGASTPLSPLQMKTHTLAWVSLALKNMLGWFLPDADSLVRKGCSRSVS
jgi:hypothetical protein